MSTLIKNELLNLVAVEVSCFVCHCFKVTRAFSYGATAVTDYCQVIQ